MTDAARDENRVTTALGVDSTDPVATLPVEINPVSGNMLIELSVATPSVTIPTGNIIPRDDNRVPVAGGVDSTDPTKIIPLIINAATGALLIEAV